MNRCKNWQNRVVPNKFRTLGSALLRLNIADYPELFDEDKTIRLIEHLISYGNIYKIYVDTDHSSLNYMGYSFIVHKPGHSDHFHIRIVDPDGIGNK